MPNAFVWTGIVYLVLFAALGLVLAIDQSPLTLARMCLWSNAFFLFPVFRAFLFAGGPGVRGYSFPAAWGEALVFLTTYAVSTVHHGCVPDDGTRLAVAADTAWMLLLGGCVALAAALYVAAAWLMRDKATRAHCIVVVLGVLAFAGLVTGFGLMLFWIGQQRMDGCLWLHDPLPDAAYTGPGGTAAALVDVWDSADFVTAFSALLIAVLFLLQLSDTLVMGVFWAMAVLLVVMQLMRRLLPTGTGPTQTDAITAVAVVGGTFLACQLLVCCTYDRRQRSTVLQRYDWLDFWAGLLLGLVAVLLFVLDNTSAVHSLWHALGALALYLSLEALYRRQSLFFVARFPDRQV